MYGWGLDSIGKRASFFAIYLVASATLGGVPGDGYAMASQVSIQIQAVLLTIVWSGVGSLVVYLIVSVLVGGLRVSEETEREGLDIVEHGERAYNL